jgi:hypothetical protein
MLRADLLPFELAPEGAACAQIASGGEEIGLLARARVEYCATATACAPTMGESFAGSGRLPKQLIEGRCGKRRTALPRGALTSLGNVTHRSQRRAELRRIAPKKTPPTCWRRC